MSYGEEQRKEIETIKKRQIKLELSDADCDTTCQKSSLGLVLITC